MTQIADTLSARGSTHGDFISNSDIMQSFKTIARASGNWQNLMPYHQESIDMICHKLGRILCGNPNHTDHWHDIAGYATLVENILVTGTSHPAEPIKSGCTD